MTPRARAAVDDLRSAAALLRKNGVGNPMSLAVASVLEAHAKYWSAWFPSEPTSSDLAMVQLAKTVHATFEIKTPDADAGTRQQTPTEKKG